MLGYILLALIGCASAESVPAYLWSGKGYLGHSKCVTATSMSMPTVSMEQFVATVKELGQKKPEVVVGFIYPPSTEAQFAQTLGAYAPASSSSTNKNAREYLKRASDISTSCLALSIEDEKTPGTHAGEGQLLLSKELAQGDVLIQGKGSNEKEFCKSVMLQLEAHFKTFMNINTDTILIEAVENNGKSKTRNRLTGDCMEQVMQLVKHHTQDNFIAFASVDAPRRSIDILYKNTYSHASNANANVHASSSSRHILAAKLSKTKNPHYPGPQFITGNIMFGLFFGFFAIFIVLFAATCLMSIHTPVRFNESTLPIAKEY